jgi:hypothetical protein
MRVRFSHFRVSRFPNFEYYNAFSLGVWCACARSRKQERHIIDPQHHDDAVVISLIELQRASGIENSNIDPLIQDNYGPSDCDLNRP